VIDYYQAILVSVRFLAQLRLLRRYVIPLSHVGLISRPREMIGNEQYTIAGNAI
jgi:hypothetical protein